MSVAEESATASFDSSWFDVACAKCTFRLAADALSNFACSLCGNTQMQYICSCSQKGACYLLFALQLLLTAVLRSCLYALWPACGELELPQGFLEDGDSSAIQVVSNFQL